MLKDPPDPPLPPPQPIPTHPPPLLQALPAQLAALTGLRAFDTWDSQLATPQALAPLSGLVSLEQLYLHASIQEDVASLPLGTSRLQVGWKACSAAMPAGAPAAFLWLL